MDSNAKYHELRERYPVFDYVAYHHRWESEGLRLWFDFRMGDIEFHPTALVEERPFINRDTDASLIDSIVFNIGMAELVSYWKCACPPLVRVFCGRLDADQVAFWRKLYWNGLGEFFYTNAIAADPDAFVQIESNHKPIQPIQPIQPTPPTTPSTDTLVPIGGGKDSVVTLELLRRAGLRVRPLIMNPRGATTECARVAGFGMDEVLVIRRTIDPVLLRLNAEGYLNGHTPFSAMLAFYNLLASALSGIPNVALSNESSANESTVLGTSVNHQYSKSLEFEDDFRSYVSRFPGFNYYSFLRPLSELQIAMLFSRLTPYHDVFRSCNVGSKQDIWCGHCAKCLFAYIILSPFIEPSRLNAIFGRPMLDDLSLLPVLQQLTGDAPTKPFECVGTVGEVQTALSLAVERWYTDARPALLAGFNPIPTDRRTPLHTLPKVGNLPDRQFEILRQCIEKNS